VKCTLRVSGYISVDYNYSQLIYQLNPYQLIVGPASCEFLIDRTMSSMQRLEMVKDKWMGAAGDALRSFQGSYWNANATLWTSI